MKVSSFLLPAGHILALTAAWWLLYTPTALPIAPLLGGHVLVTAAVYAGLHLAGPRWRNHWSRATTLWMVLGVAPPVLARFHGAGLLKGAGGLALAGMTLTLCVLFGALGGRGLQKMLGATRAIGSMVFLGTSIALAVFTGPRPLPLDVPQPRADAIEGGLPWHPTAVIGIDGGDWQVANQLMSEGLLPNLEAFIQAGQRGVLRSTVPSYSPVVWTTLFSGRHPEVHGLRDWYSSDARNRRVPALWNLLDAHGLSTITINVPGTWPPQELGHGTLISGFPIPGSGRGNQELFLGQILTSGDDDGLIPTTRLTPSGPDRFEGRVEVQQVRLQPRFSGFSHAIVDAANRHNLMPVQSASLSLQVTRLDDSVRLDGLPSTPAVVLTDSESTPWFQVKDPDLEVDATLRITLLESSEAAIRLFVSPAYQTAENPRFPFATGTPAGFFGPDRPYIVEGMGWTAHRDPRASGVVLDTLLDTARIHQDAVERLLERGQPDLLSYVITVTDRLQHPFWGSWDPDAYERPTQETERPSGRRPVREAWRLADENLGRLMDRLNPKTLVFLVSDHGAAPEAGHHEGGHRPEGIWAARGPMVPHSEEMTELEIEDLLPTLLRCVGAPLARDLAGQPGTHICPGAADVEPVDTYVDAKSAEPTSEPSTTIDAEREQQLRSLGYIE